MTPVSQRTVACVGETLTRRRREGMHGECVSATQALDLSCCWTAHWLSQWHPACACDLARAGPVPATAALAPRPRTTLTWVRSAPVRKQPAAPPRPLLLAVILAVVRHRCLQSPCRRTHLGPGRPTLPLPSPVMPAWPWRSALLLHGAAPLASTCRGTQLKQHRGWRTPTGLLQGGECGEKAPRAAVTDLKTQYGRLDCDADACDGADCLCAAAGLSDRPIVVCATCELVRLKPCQRTAGVVAPASLSHLSAGPHTVLRLLGTSDGAGDATQSLHVASWTLQTLVWLPVPDPAGAGWQTPVDVAAGAGLVVEGDVTVCGLSTVRAHRFHSSHHPPRR